MKRVCVFCGSNPGSSPAYLLAARNLGRILASRQIGLVYGGGMVGMMGEVAGAALAEGGEVIGVSPKMFEEMGVLHDGLSELRIVNTMHERKALMAELSDAFIALPGGLGTFEELLEVLTWTQLGIHHKPCGLLNVNGYYLHLVKFLDHAVSQAFVKKEHAAMLLVDETPKALLDRLTSFKAPKISKLFHH